MAIATVNDVRLHYEIHGSGETVFLTHGSWGDATGWDGVVPRLAERFEVVVWDRRGHSRSSVGNAAQTIDQDAADLGALIEHLDRRGAHVYGSSSGGTVVLKLACTRSDLVSSVTAHEPAVPGLLDDIGDKSTIRALVELRMHLDRVRTMIETGASDAAARYFVDNVAVGPGAWDQFPETARRIFSANASTYAEEIADPTAFLVDTDRLAGCDVPIMVTLGSESPVLLLAASRELLSRVPCAGTATFEGSGHVPYRTHPDLWVSSLVDYYTALKG
jgi:pimeloyl-ACP methyl ester carboxylesterase